MKIQKAASVALTTFAAFAACAPSALASSPRLVLTTVAEPSSAALAELSRQAESGPVRMAQRFCELVGKGYRNSGCDSGSSSSGSSGSRSSDEVEYTGERDSSGNRICNYRGRRVLCR